MKPLENHFTRKLLHVGSLLLLFSVLFHFPSNAQDASGDRVMFVEMEKLSTTTYVDLAGLIKESEDLSIKQTCIPAKIVMFTLPASNTESLEMNFYNLQVLILDVVDIGELKILAEYSEQDFLDRCLEFRMRSTQE